ncbi:MAG TPA: DegV family protein [Anaerolineae bacterium]|nr:DegV family protein [Anaerolineae bacterium]
MSSSKPTTAIVTDSTSDLPKAEALELGVAVVPALLTVGEETLVDGVGISRPELYARMPDISKPVTTAAPSASAFEEVYEKALTAGATKVISIHLSSKLSGMLNVAHQAALEFGKRIHLIDSEQVSLGLGFQVIEAAKHALEGLPFEAVIETARRAREKTKLIAFMNTLEYLRRGGRVSWLSAGLGNILQVKLLLEIVNGVVEQFARVRTRTKALDHMLEYARSWGPLKRLGIPHAAAPEAASALAEELSSVSQLSPMIVDVTTVIGAHVGPGAVGIIGMRA